MNLKDYKWNGLNNRYEIIGIIFLVIATIMTIFTWDSFGIVAMFGVGLVCIGHKQFCYFGCRCACHRNDEEFITDEFIPAKSSDKMEKETHHKKKEI